MIVPVWVSSKSSSRDEYLVYALLDTQSDTTFILEKTADILEPNSETANLRLSTMSARDNVICCQKLRGLQVRGYDSDVFIDLPITYSRNFIPTDRSHIPTPTIAKRWPHLRRIARLMHPVQDCEVGLLIGYNCPLALAPRSYITGDGNQPFAIQTDLGRHRSIRAIGTTHRIVVKEIDGNNAKRFYVANRIQIIREATEPNQWHYVATEKNQAEYASRGLGATELISSKWFSGPSFLWERELPEDEDNHWELLADVKHGHAHAVRSQGKASMPRRLEHFSDWSRAAKGIAELQQFLSRRRNPKKEDKNQLASEEDREKARQIILKMVQQEAFAEEICQLKNDSSDEMMKERSQLYKLDPFLDKDGILRVGGRLTMSYSLHYRVKHPMILPKKGHVTSLVIKHCHEKVAHQGRGMTVNEVRSRGFWIVGNSSAVSSHIYKCVQCRRLRGRTQVQKMANLPEERVEPSPPFTCCGFDCFGPFIVKEGRKDLNRFGLLFTCMSSRAVHIEMPSSMHYDVSSPCAAQ